jgi:hypothetical protein
VQFIPMALCKFGGVLRKFSFKASPSTLFILLMFGQQQSDGFLSRKLRDSRKVFDAQPIQNLGTGKLSCAQTQRHSMVSVGTADFCVGIGAAVPTAEIMGHEVRV